ncbi:MAG: helical backbone metal receptor [Candidatus Zipacnadales bacterium]
MTSTSMFSEQAHGTRKAREDYLPCPFGASVRLIVLLLASFATSVGCRTAKTEARALQQIAEVWPRTYEDALGKTVTLTAPPQRIVSLSPAITEMLFAIGAGSRVVGVTEFCDYPPEAQKLPTVGQYTAFSVERVLELRPDVVIGMRGTSKDSLTALHKAGVAVLAYDPITVEDVLDTMETLGHMIQTKPAEVKMVNALRERVAAVKAQSHLLSRRPRVLCVVAFEPLYAAGPDNHIDDMIRLAGGENTAADASIPWPQYSLERMLEKDPEIIIIPVGHEDKGDDPQATPEFLVTADGWRDTTAVKHHAVVQIIDDLLTLPGPRIVDGLEIMATAIQRAAGVKE